MNWPWGLEVWALFPGRGQWDAMPECQSLAESIRAASATSPAE